MTETESRVQQRSSERSEAEIARLQSIAKQVRRNILLEARGKGEGYVGQGLGAADIATALYFHEMNYDPGRVDWPERDRFVLSTGHYSILIYAALTALGVFPEERLADYGADESPFGMATHESTPGVEISGGSLGQGLSQSVGMALGSRLSGKGFRVFNFLSDGELQEGSTWEAAMSAAHFGLDNLVAVVDVNSVQADGKVADILAVEPIVDKWTAFGWHAAGVNGNSMSELVDALHAARESGGRPHVIVCYTVMGRGVDFIETRPKGHFVRVDEDEWELALSRLEEVTA